MQLSPAIYKYLVRPDWFYNKFIRKVIEANTDLTGKTVLDFGCGIGTCSKMFEPEFYIGLDCDQKRIEYAKRLYPDTRFICSNVKDIEIYDNSLDCILISSVLHHVDDDSIKEYLEQFKRMLKEDGYIIVLEPCYEDKRIFANWWMKTFDKGQYIRKEVEYISLFCSTGYKTTIVSNYNQCHMYNKILFTAYPN